MDLWTNPTLAYTATRESEKATNNDHRNITDVHQSVLPDKAVKSRWAADKDHRPRHERQCPAPRGAGATAAARGSDALAGGPAGGTASEPAGEASLAWTVQADAAMSCQLELVLAAAGLAPAEASIRLCFLPAIQIAPHSYIPEPTPVHGKALIGAHHCPLWEADKPEMWANVVKHPERTPALGFYAQENPEVSDWETKWAVEHGIVFRLLLVSPSQGGP